MKFRRDAPMVLIGVVVVVTLLSAFVSNRLFGGMASAVEQSEYDTMENIIVYDVEAAKSRALSRAEMIAALPDARQLLASHDRSRLGAEYLEMFEVQRDKHGIDQMHFYVPPATSFLRLHAPERYDDDVSLIRPMIVAVNRDRVATKGVAIGRAGPAIFGAAPIFDHAGVHVGAFEVGIAFGSLLDNLKVAYGLEFALFLEEERLDPEGVPKDVLVDDNRLGKYVKYHATHWQLLQQLVGAGDLARVEESVRYTREALGVPYGVVLVPLRDIAGTQLGVVVVAKNFEASRAATGRSAVWQTLVAVFAIVVLAGAIQVVVQGFLVRPLAAITGRFGRLAEGEPDQPVPDRSLLCDELQALAAQHDRLRMQAHARRESAPPDEDGAP